MKKIFLSVACFAALLFSACGGKEGTNPTVDCNGSTPTYNLQVKAVFDAGTCGSVGCHDTATKEQGYDFSSYATSKAAVTAKKTEVLGAINHTSGFDKMPKGLAKLSDGQIKLVTCWIENGAPE